MKKFLFVLAMFLLIFSVTACSTQGNNNGEPSNEEPSNDEQVTLRFLSHIYKPWNDLLSLQMREFEELHPNVKIEFTTVEHADLNTRIMTSLSANTAPNIMGVYGPWMADLVEHNWIAEAPSFAEEDIRNNSLEVAGESAEYNGKLYGYIQHIGIPTPIINERLYKEAGVGIPVSYDDLLDANKKLDIFDAGNMTQAGTTLATTRGGSWNVIHWSSILKAFGAEIISEDGTKAAFNTPQGLEATEMYGKLTHSGFLEDAFTLEKSAMAWTGPWSKASYQKNFPDLQYKAIQPLQGPAKQVTSMYAWFWAVSADASPAEQEWSWRLLEFLSSDEKYLETANKIGFISFRKANYDNEDYVSDPWIKAFGEALEVAEVYYSKIPNWEQIDVVIGQELERMVVGETTPEQTLENAEKRINEILAEK